MSVSAHLFPSEPTVYRELNDDEYFDQLEEEMDRQEEQVGPAQFSPYRVHISALHHAFVLP